MRRTLTIGLLVLALIPLRGAMRGAQAQELPPLGQNVWHVDSASGRVYWNRHRPIYLNISPTPNGADGITLKSQSMPQWSCPFYLDTEGINYLRTRWAVDTATRKAVQPQREVLWEVYSDGNAPTTTTKYLEASQAPGKGTVLGGKSRVVLTSRDALSGVAATYYSLNGGPFQLFGGEIPLGREGNNELRYFSDDRVGNREPIRTAKFVLDLKPPTTRCLVTGIHLANNTLAKHSVITLQATDDFSGVVRMRYRIDSGAWVNYAPKSTISLQRVGDGHHVLHFKSWDYAGNEEETQEFRFFLDETAPITISDVLGDKFIVDGKTFFSGRTKMKITAVDNHAGVKEVFYSVDGGPFQPYKEPFYMPNAMGWHVVKYYSIDSTENRTTGPNADRYYEYRMKMDRVYVDLAGPKLSHQVSGERFVRHDSVFVSPRSQITLAGKDYESGFKRLSYSLDGDKWERDYEGPFDLSGLASGEHQVEFFGYDNVENRNVSQFRFILDKEAPRMSYSLSVAPYKHGEAEQREPVYPVDAEVYLTAQDNMTGVRLLQCSLNGQPLMNYTKPLRGLVRGQNSLQLRAVDMVGNVREETHTFNAR